MRAWLEVAGDPPYIRQDKNRDKIRNDIDKSRSRLRLPVRIAIVLAARSV